MRALAGTLDSFSATEVLALVAASRASGALHLRGSSEGTVYTVEGAVTHAASHPNDGLGTVLVRAGFLTNQEMARAIGANDGGRQLAEALAAKGTDAEHLLAFIRHQSEEAVFEVGQWDRGEFRFETGETHPLGDAFRYPFDALMEGVVRRRDQWGPLVERLGSIDALVRPVPIMPGDETELQITRAQYRLLGALDGDHTVRDLAYDLGEGVFHTCQVVVNLLDAELVQLGPERPRPPVASLLNAAGNGRSSLAGPLAPLRDEDLVAAATPGNGNGNGKHAEEADEPVAAAAAVRAKLGGPEFAVPGGRPDRGLVLKLLSAVKELNVEGGDR